MFPLRSHHLVSRTPAGEKAWHELRLPPAQRKLLGLLRQPMAVSALLQAHGAEPGALEELVWTSARAGYLRVDIVETTSAPLPVAETHVQDEEVDQDKALQDLLDRHRPTSVSEDDLSSAAQNQEGNIENVPGLRYPVDNGPLPAPSPESAAALARALMGGDSPGRRAQPSPAPEPSPQKEDVYLIKSSMDLMRALTGQATPYVSAPPLDTPRFEAPPLDEPENLPDVHLDSPYATDPAPREVSPADREDTFLRITEVIKSRQAASAPGIQGMKDPPVRSRGESDVAYAARLQALEARAARQAAEEERRQEMAVRRLEEAEQMRKNTREGLSDRLKKALNQRDSSGEG